MSTFALNRRSAVAGLISSTSAILSATASSSAWAQTGNKAAFMRAVVAKIKKEHDDTEREIKELAKKGTVPYFVQLPKIIAFADWDYFFIDRDLVWLPNEGQKFAQVDVPSGFVSDLASVPQIFWSVIPKTGRYAYAAIVHDYLYWAQSVKRSEADRIFQIAMQDSKVSSATLQTMYEAVRLGGQAAWDQNAKSKAKGEKRVLKNFPQDPLISWADWRKQRGVFLD
jgi:hypothetical protein